MTCLRQADGATLTLAGSQTINTRPATLYVFSPLVDGVFVREGPVEGFLNGRFAHVPTLFG